MTLAEMTRKADLTEQDWSRLVRTVASLINQPINTATLFEVRGTKWAVAITTNNEVVIEKLANPPANG